MLKAIVNACSQLTNFWDFWLVAALGDWSFEEGDRNTSFRRYMDSWHDPDLPLPTELLCAAKLGINGLLSLLIGQQSGVEASERNQSHGHDIVFRANECSFSVEVKYLFDCAYSKQYEHAIPADRDKCPDYQVVFFVSFPNYRYPAGRWYGSRRLEPARQTNVVGLAAQYSKVCRFLGQTASWPSGNSPHRVDLPQGTDIITQDRIQRRFARVFQPAGAWQFSTITQLKGAQVGCAIWGWSAQ
jgi:hypothetical protein